MLFFAERLPPDFLSFLSAPAAIKERKWGETG
jgi:hypothetical protein